MNEFLLSIVHSSKNMLIWLVAGAPRIQLDGLNTDIKVKAGEPFKVKVPFKGSPVPTSTWYNVSALALVVLVFCLFDTCTQLS